VRLSLRSGENQLAQLAGARQRPACVVRILLVLRIIAVLRFGSETVRYSAVMLFFSMTAAQRA